MTHAAPFQPDPESNWQHAPVDAVLDAFLENGSAVVNAAHEPGSRSGAADEVTPASAAMASLVDLARGDTVGHGPAYTTGDIDAELAEKEKAGDERAAARAAGHSPGVPLLRNMSFPTGEVGLPGLEREEADGPHAQGVFGSYTRAAAATAAAAEKALTDPVAAAQVRPTGKGAQEAAPERTTLSDYVVSMAVGRAMTAYYADLVRQFGAEDVHSVAVDMSTIYGFGMDARVGRAEDGATIHRVESDPILITTIAVAALSRMALGGTRDARLQRLKRQMLKERRISIGDYKTGYETLDTDSQGDQLLAREVLTQLVAGSPGNRPMTLDGQLSRRRDGAQQPQPSDSTEHVVGGRGGRHAGSTGRSSTTTENSEHSASRPGSNHEATGGPRRRHTARHGRPTDANPYA